MDKENKDNHTLRVFEAFAGIGAQASALDRMGINYKIVGISEWFIDAIECYAAIHCDNVEVEMPTDIQTIDEYLSKFTFSATSVKPTNIKRLTEDQRRDLYRANKQANNFGSITDIKGTDLPEIDLLVYSFPCQDLSTGGLGKGMKKGSGTRSGLLWEIERILTELKDIDHLPEYLLLENVKTIKADKHIKDLNQWLDFLESMGYANTKCMILNSLDFGVPQDRERAFIISHLGDTLDVVNKIEAAKKERKFKIRKFIKSNYKNPIYKLEADIAQLNKTPSRDVMWAINGKTISNHMIVRTITCNMDRTHTAALFKYNGPKGDTYRRLTMREAFLLMGFTEKEYAKASSLNFSYRKLNKLIGNSIVVNRLIWDLQEVPSCIDEDIAAISKIAFDVMYDESRPTANIESYCKREECWTNVAKQNYTLSEDGYGVLITPAEKQEESVRAKKDQRIASGIEDELGIFRKGSDYWKSLAEKGKSQNVLSSKDLSIIDNAVKYCEFVYTSLYPKQVKEIINVLNKLKENGIE